MEIVFTGEAREDSACIFTPCNRAEYYTVNVIVTKLYTLQATIHSIQSGHDEQKIKTFFGTADSFIARLDEQRKMKIQCPERRRGDEHNRK